MENNVGLLLSKRAALSGDVEAFVDAETGLRLPFSELNKRTNQTAHMLKGQGIQKGDRVALLLRNSVEFCQAYFAGAKIGAVMVPLNWRLVADELEFIIKDSGATMLIYDDQFQAVVDELHTRGVATDISRWVQCRSPEGAPPGYGLIFEAEVAPQPGTEPAIEASEDDLLYIMYTSGTTGLPKGVVHTHNSMLWALITGRPLFDMRQRERALILLPLFHVGALMPFILNVYSGLTSVVCREFNPVTTWELIASERINTFVAVPAMLNFMLQVPDLEHYDYSSVRSIMAGAAPVPVSIIQRYNQLGIEIQQVYGLTESCGPGCLIDSANAIKRAGSTGKSYFHTSVRIIDEQGRDTAPGEAGEIIIAGKHNMKEYWNRPEATAETLRDGWLYTGDIAYMDEDGFIYIQDRIKDMIISGGENVYPAEVENIILDHDKVLEVAVIGQPSERWGESPFAIVVRKDETLSEQDILAHCQGKLARFKQPVGAAFIDVIPRNPTGKILKRLLRDQFPGPAPV